MSEMLGEETGNFIDNLAGDIPGSASPVIEEFQAINTIKKKKMDAATSDEDKEDCTPQSTPTKKSSTMTSKKAATTPRKRAAATNADKDSNPNKRRSPAKAKCNVSDEDVTTPTKVKTGGLPKTLAEATEVDRLLLQMKDEGKSIKEMNAMYEEKTGKKPGKSTLSVRICRLRASLARLSDGDDLKLYDANQEWEKYKEEQVQRLENNRYQKIAELMEKKDCQKYAVDLLKRELKSILDLEAKGQWSHSEGPGADASEEGDNLANGKVAAAESEIRGENVTGESISSCGEED